MYVVENRKASQASIPAPIKERIINGYNPQHSGEIQLILKPHYCAQSAPKGTTHGLWNPYDSHIPLIFFGKGIPSGQTVREVYMTDIAPTVAALLKIQMPSATVGKAKILLISVKTPPISDRRKKEGETTGQEDLFKK